MEDSVFPAGSLCAVQAQYGEYISQVEDYFGSRSMGGTIAAMFSGTGRYGGCPLHQLFLDQLSATLRLVAANPPEDAELDALLRFLLCTEHAAPSHPAALGLAAAEGLAASLFSLAGTPELSAVFEVYSGRLKKSRPFPVQRQTLDLLRQELKKRGA